MATSKKKQLEKEKEQAYQKVKEGMERPKVEIPVAKEEDIVVLEIQNKVKPFLKFSLLHSWRTKKMSYIGSSAICLAAGIFYIFAKSYSNSALFFSLAVVFPVLLAVLHCLSARTQLKKDDEFNQTKHVYHFRENEFEGVSTYNNHSAKFAIDYKNLMEGINKGDFVYLYVNKGTAFVIEKANFLKGDREQLEVLLAKVKGYVK